MDTATLRVAFGLVAVCVLVLFYGVTYRSTRAAYSGWWCGSLSLFIAGALLYLLNGTPLQVVANPLGNALGVLGAGCMWAGARSLGGRPVLRAWLVLPAIVVLVVSLLDDPVHDVWTGGAAYLAGMALLMGGSAVELRAMVTGERLPEDDQHQVHFALVSIAVASGAISLFYVARTVVFVALGPDHVAFRTAFGSQAVTLLTMLLLVLVTFSMSALSHAQQTSELRIRATRDDLTGLLNRSEFLRAAEAEIRTGRYGGRAAVVVADLDRFKELNDGFGHAAGDMALTAFADSCHRAIGSRGLVGRLGGDEFLLLVPDAGAEETAAEISRIFQVRDVRAPLPTVSFGIAAVPRRDVALGVAHADEALYRAKAAGRARTVRHLEPGRRTELERRTEPERRTA